MKGKETQRKAQTIHGIGQTSVTITCDLFLQRQEHKPDITVRVL